MLNKIERYHNQEVYINDMDLWVKNNNWLIYNIDNNIKWINNLQLLWGMYQRSLAFKKVYHKIVIDIFDINIL